MLTQLYGDSIMIANATGCSSIYGGNLPTTPYKTNDKGRGPTWANSLFEDNAEFGLGMKLALIPPGRFRMGWPETEEGRDEEEYQHPVEITRPFYLGVHEASVWY